MAERQSRVVLTEQRNLKVENIRLVWHSNVMPKETKFSPGSIGAILLDEFGDATRIRRFLLQHEISPGARPIAAFAQAAITPTARKKLERQADRDKIETLRRVVVERWATRTEEERREDASDFLWRHWGRRGLLDDGFKAKYLFAVDPDLYRAYRSLIRPVWLRAHPENDLLIGLGGGEGTAEERRIARARKEAIVADRKSSAALVSVRTQGTRAPTSTQGKARGAAGVSRPVGGAVNKQTTPGRKPPKLSR